MATSMHDVVTRLDLKALNELRDALGYRPLNLIWAKCRIVLGLLAFGSGIFLGFWTLTPGTALADRAVDVIAALTQIVVGGYLILDGQRTHLYMSSDHLTAYILHVIRHPHESATQ